MSAVKYHMSNVFVTFRFRVTAVFVRGPVQRGKKSSRTLLCGSQSAINSPSTLSARAGQKEFKSKTVPGVIPKWPQSDIIIDHGEECHRSSIVFSR